MGMDGFGGSAGVVLSFCSVEHCLCETLDSLPTAFISFWQTYSQYVYMHSSVELWS